MTKISDVALDLLDEVERLVIENRKLLINLLSSREADTSGFSVDDLIQETPHGEQIQKDVRSLYGKVRERILQADADGAIHSLAQAIVASKTLR